MPLPIVSQLVAANGLDFGLMEDKYLIGGWRVVPTKADMLKLHDSKRRAGMIVRVRTNPPTNYELQDDLQTWKEVDFGATLTLYQLLSAIKSLHKTETARRVAGSLTDFQTVNVFDDAALVFLGGSIQTRGSDYTVVSDNAGNKVYRFVENIDAGYPVLVVGWIASAPATSL